jgi:carbon-monoxide dehydrogenase large subunit
MIGERHGLEETAVFDPVNFAFPGGSHVADVEIDPDTGELHLVAYTAVDDVASC